MKGVNANDENGNKNEWRDVRNEEDSKSKTKAKEKRRNDKVKEKTRKRCLKMDRPK